MENEFWVSLPVRSIKRSREFFIKLGFEFPQHKDPDVLHLKVDSSNINFFEEPLFKAIAGNEISDTQKTSEVLLTLNVESMKRVDEMCSRAGGAGGTVFNKPDVFEKDYYRGGFADLDGHRWNIIYKINKKPTIKSYFDGEDTHGHLV